ncbi:MAG: 50S ribosomal protein L18a [Candidatus Diapherotrites archaeon]|nr:50S ribosomal protein L18a [Candidatus Diapherotrites archaeon]
MESTKKLENFEVKGKVKTKEGEKQFLRQLKAFGEKNASERILTFFGSQNKIKRRHIKIEEVKKLG